MKARLVRRVSPFLKSPSSLCCTHCEKCIDLGDVATEPWSAVTVYMQSCHATSIPRLTLSPRLLFLEVCRQQRLARTISSRRLGASILPTVMPKIELHCPNSPMFRSSASRRRSPCQFRTSLRHVITVYPILDFALRGQHSTGQGARKAHSWIFRHARSAR